MFPIDVSKHGPVNLQYTKYIKEEWGMWIEFHGTSISWHKAIC
jgi:hypothetical protein